MKARDLFDLLLLAAIWGASFLFLRVASPQVGPVAVAACRVAGGALLLLPLVMARREHRALGRHSPQLLGAALLSAVLPFLGLSQAAQGLPAGQLSILNATTPMWGALIGWLWVGEAFTVRRAWGLGLGFAGVALLAADRTQLHAPGALGAVMLALGSTLMYALSVHYNKRFLSDLSPVSNSAGTLATAALVLAGPALWLGPQPQAPIGEAPMLWSEVTRQVWLAIAGLAALCTGLAYLVFYRLIERIGPSRALTVTFLIPVFGMVWGAMFLGERVSLPMVLATLVILAGTWLANHVKPAPASVPQEART